VIFLIGYNYIPIHDETTPAAMLQAAVSRTYITFCVDREERMPYDAMLLMMKAGEPIECKGGNRQQDNKKTCVIDKGSKAKG